MKKISIVIPVKNEYKIILENISLIVNYLENNFFQYEILVIENGSTDNTISILQSISSLNQNIKVYSLKKAMFGEAIRIGVTQSKYDIVFVSMDLAMGIDFIMDSYCMLSKYDFVNGSRYIKKDSIDRSFLRKSLSILNIKLSNLIFNCEFTDFDACKAFKNSVGKNLFTISKSNHNFLLTEVLINLVKQGYSFCEIPVIHNEHRKSRFNIYKLILNHLQELVLHKATLMFKK
jgi:glycosyltransferase involved in cell wall biosynthesis